MLWPESWIELPDEKVPLVRITLFPDLPTHHTPPTASASFQGELVSRSDTPAVKPRIVKQGVFNPW